MSVAPGGAHGRRARRGPVEPEPGRRTPGAAWWLAVASFGPDPVRPGGGGVDPRTARDALLWAPVAALPLGLLVGVVVRLGAALGLPGPATGALAVVVLALGTRAVTLRALTSTADRLLGSGVAGRVIGTVVLLVVLGAQVLALGALASRPRGAVVAGLLVCLSRGALLLTCARGVPDAPGGSTGPYPGRVPRTTALLGWVLVVAWTAVATRVGGDLHDGTDYLRGGLAALAAAVVVGLLLRHGVRRTGGADADLHGACVEVALTVLLLGIAAG